MSNRQYTHRDHQPAGETYPMCFLLHDILLPMNVGSLFRIADALGVAAIYLSGRTPVPPNRRIRKTSRATEQSVAWQSVPDPLALIAQLKAQQYKIISLELSAASIDVGKLALSEQDRVCLIPGAENHGVSQKLLAASDVTVHIPMHGVNSSMNVANACAIASYAILQQLRTSQ